MTGTENTSGNPAANPLLAPEFRLLSLCARVTLSSDSHTALNSLLAQNLNWDLVHRLAKHHGMLPRLHVHLARRTEIPHEVRAQFAQAGRQAALQSGYLAAELCRLGSILQAAGIRALAYKGPVLGTLLYGEQALRVFSDLDLLVRPEENNLEAVFAALTAAGYAPEYEFPPHLRRAYLRTGMVYEFWSPGRNYRVELHWKPHSHPSFSAGFDAECLWGETHRVRVGGQEIETLSNVNALLLLAMHAAKHGWDQLSCLSDMAGLAERLSAEEWDLLWQRARSARCVRLLSLSLALCNRLLQTSFAVPEVGSLGIVAEKIERNLALQRSAGTLLQLRLRDGVAARLRLLWYLLATPGKLDYLQFPLPRPAVCLYPLLRVYRLWRDHWRGRQSKSPSSPAATVAARVGHA